jgi:hypothetical protein
MADYDQARLVAEMKARGFLPADWAPREKTQPQPKPAPKRPGLMTIEERSAAHVLPPVPVGPSLKCKERETPTTARSERDAW